MSPKEKGVHSKGGGLWESFQEEDAVGLEPTGQQVGDMWGTCDLGPLAPGHHNLEASCPEKGDIREKTSNLKYHRSFFGQLPRRKYCGWVCDDGLLLG